MPRALNRNVGYAKHAISIDENRASFKRVPWSTTAEKQDQRDAHGNVYFEQVWLSGVHADVGGGYLENEARLSDMALKLDALGRRSSRMVSSIMAASCGYLQTPPDRNTASGQHPDGGCAPPSCRSGESASPMHKSVYKRFEADHVLLYDRMAP